MATDRVITIALSAALGFAIERPEARADERGGRGR
jgi:hypothetical protein